MLPRSLFSASSLKYGQPKDGNSEKKASSSTSANSHSPIRNDYLPQMRESGMSAQSPLTIDSENEQYVSAESVSQAASSDDDDDRSAPSNLQELIHHLIRLQAKQTAYIEKTRQIGRRIQETNAKIADLTGVSVPQPSSKYSRPVTSAPSKSPAKPPVSCPSPSSPSSAITQQSPTTTWKRPQLAKRTGSSTALPAAKVSRTEFHQQELARDEHVSSTAAVMTGAPVAAARTESQIQPKSAITSSSHGRIIMSESPLPSPSAQSIPEPAELKLASRDTCDLYLHRNQVIKNAAFSRKPRSLLYNIANGQGDLKDLMVVTTLKGDLQCWDASKRSLIKTIDPEHIYPDSWIEELCWTTKNTLALCRGSDRSGGSYAKEKTVSLMHMESLSDHDVKHRVQHLNESPHQKSILAIAPMDLGTTGSVGVERASFVTGGSDKAIYLWDIIRDSPYDDFALSDVSQLNISHTSAVHTLCYNSTHRKLFSGGADSKMFVYDMISQKMSNEMKIGHRVNHILKSPVDPNLHMIMMANTNDQFAIYDQRTPGVRGIVLNFGYTESENLSRYLRPDWHQDGYMVVSGSQSESKVHFWDIRYSGVDRGPCFSFGIHSSPPTRILGSLFVPNENTLVTISSTKAMSWTDYSVQRDSRIHGLGAA